MRDRWKRALVSMEIAEMRAQVAREPGGIEVSHEDAIGAMRMLPIHSDDTKRERNARKRARRARRAH